MIKNCLSAALLLFPLFGIAQTCSGSLGDPVLNETFGSGHYILDANKTSYTYTGGCPPKYSYTLGNFLFGCGDVNGAWAKMIGDHTRNEKGNYMLVNAESMAGTVFMDTAKGICGATVYQFGIWVTSVMTKYACGGKPVLPDLKFQVKTLSGVIIGSDSTGYLPLIEEREWKFYNFSFTTPPGIGDVIVSITVDPEYGCGSAFAIDDITLRPCGPLISATIDGTPGPAEVCADYKDPFILNANYSAGFTDPVLQWQSSIDTGKTWIDIPGETTLSYAVPRRTSDVILYRIGIAERVNINSARCRINSNSIYTRIHPLPEHKAPQSLIGCINKDYFFPEADPKALQVLWTGPNGYSSTQPNAVVPGIQYTDSGLYKLKETFSYNCVSLDTFNLKIFPSTTISVQPSFPICEGKSEQLFASATGNVSYQWMPPTGLSNDAIPDPIARPPDSVKYKVVVTNEYGCKDSAYLVVNVYRNPAVNAGPDKTILIGDTATLNGIVKGTAINYYWSPANFISDSHIAVPKVNPPVNTNYILNVTSTVGCGSASDEVFVKVYNSFYVPNAFTPNEDGKNDKFKILMLDNYKLVHFIIYNRWGQAVFKSEGLYNGWDGTFKGLPQPAGVYIYNVEIETSFGKKIEKQGTVLLIR